MLQVGLFGFNPDQVRSSHFLGKHRIFDGSLEASSVLEFIQAVGQPGRLHQLALPHDNDFALFSGMLSRDFRHF